MFPSKLQLTFVFEKNESNLNISKIFKSKILSRIRLQIVATLFLVGKILFLKKIFLSLNALVGLYYVIVANPPPRLPLSAIQSSFLSTRVIHKLSALFNNVLNHYKSILKSIFAKFGTHMGPNGPIQEFSYYIQGH